MLRSLTRPPIQGLYRTQSYLSHATCVRATSRTQPSAFTTKTHPVPIRTFHSTVPPASEDSPLASTTGPKKSAALKQEIDIPTEANIVVIGGGVIGCSIAYHLAKYGAKNVYLLEKSQLTHGCTWHAAGLLGQLRGTKNLTRMLQYSAECFSQLQADTGIDPEWRQVGSIRVAASMERWKEIKRSSSQAASFGFGMHLIDKKEIKDLCPVLETDDLVGGAWIPTDGHVEPTSLTNAFAAGARQRGVKILQGIEVVGMEEAKANTSNMYQRGRIGSLLVKSKHGSDPTKVHKIQVNQIVNAGGLWARKLGQVLNINIPTINVEHQYLVTERITTPGQELPKNLPSFRDPDALLYYKPEMGGLVIGGWESNTKAVDVPHDFGPELYEGNMERFESHAENAARRTPVLNSTGIKKLVNGPIPISPDGEPIMGLCSEYSNVFVAAGFTAGIGASGGAGKYIAEWMLAGEPSIDLWPLDIRRFSPSIHRTRTWLELRGIEAYGNYYKLHYPGKEHHSGRELRHSGAYEQTKEQGAVFGTKFGWERPNYFARGPDGTVVTEHESKPSFNRRQGRSDSNVVVGNEWDYVRQEHLAARSAAVMIDQSSFAKMEVSGRDAPAFIQRLTNNDLSGPPGTVVYTQLLNEAGGIEADVTIARISEFSFYVITGSGFGTRDFGWIRSNIPPKSDIHLNEVTAQYGVVNVAGPNSRKILTLLGVEENVSNGAFPFMAWKHLNLACGVRLRALRVTYVGELGYELHVSQEQMALVYQQLSNIATTHPELGLVPAGYRCLETLRLEKGYRVWSSDLNPQTNPLEAGLGFCCKWDKPNGFIGEPALKKLKESGGPKRKLICFTLESDASISNSSLGFTHSPSDGQLDLKPSDPLFLYGNEAILYRGQVVSYSTSAGYGYSVGSHIVYGYLPTELADIKTSDPANTGFQLNAYGTIVNLVKQPMNKSLYDPKREKILM